MIGASSVKMTGMLAHGSYNLSNAVQMTEKSKSSYLLVLSSQGAVYTLKNQIQHILTIVSHVMISGGIPLDPVLFFKILNFWEL